MAGQARHTRPLGRQGIVIIGHLSVITHSLMHCVLGDGDLITRSINWWRIQVRSSTQYRLANSQIRISLRMDLLRC